MQDVMKVNEELEAEVSELSKELIRSQRNAQQSQVLLQQLAGRVLDLLEVEDRNNLTIEDIVGILASRLDKPDPADNTEIE